MIWVTVGPGANLKANPRQWLRLAACSARGNLTNMARSNDLSSFPMQFPGQETSFDPQAFDDLLQSQGVLLEHWRAQRCPVGMVDKDDIRRPHDHHENCSNGFLYTKAGHITGIFQSNSKTSNFQDEGRFDDSTSVITVPRFYESCLDQPAGSNTPCPVRLAQFDRVYYCDANITDENWQTFEASPTGKDRMQFPVLKVYSIVDSRGVRYVQDVDFIVKDGLIVWNGVGPGLDQNTGGTGNAFGATNSGQTTGGSTSVGIAIGGPKGVVCSIRYEYRPYFYVQRLLHQVRIAQVDDGYGNRSTMRFPQQALIKREVFFDKEESRDLPDGQAESRRVHPGPGDGILGPR